MRDPARSCRVCATGAGRWSCRGEVEDELSAVGSRYEAFGCRSARDRRGLWRHGSSATARAAYARRAAACRSDRYATRPRTASARVSRPCGPGGPATRAPRGTVESISSSRPSRCDSVATSRSPAFAARFGSSTVASIGSSAFGIRVAGSAFRPCGLEDVRQRRRPRQVAFRADTRPSSHPAHRWIEALAMLIG